MNPTRPPIPPYNGRPFSSETMTNPLYGMHVNAAGPFGAGPSTHSAQPGSNGSPTSFYPPHLAQHSKPARPPPLMPKPSALAPLPPSLRPGSGPRSKVAALSSFEGSLFFQPNSAPLPSPSIFSTNTTSHPYAHGLYASSTPVLPPKPHLQTHSHRSLGPLPEGTAPKLPPKHFSTPGRLPPRAPVPVSPVSSDNDEFIARALEFSLQDTRPFAHSDLEDNILARALEESLASINTPTAHDTRTYPNTSSPRQVEEDKSNAEPQSASSSSPSSSSRSFVETPATSNYSHTFDADNAGGEEGKHASLTIDVEELARQEQELIRAAKEERRKQMEMDEEFARNLARMEASSAPNSPMRPPVSPGISSGALLVPSSDGTSRPPLYNDALRRPSSFHAASLSQQNQPYHSNSHIAPASAPNIVPESRPLPSPKGAPLGRSYASYSAGGPPLSSIPSVEKLSRSTSAQASIPSSSLGVSTSGCIASDRAPIIKSDSRPNVVIPTPSNRVSLEGIPSTPKARPKPGLDGLTHRTSGDSANSTSASLGKVREGEESEDDSLSIMSPSTEAEHDEGRMVSNTPPSSAPIVEKELLMGVSFEFNAPSMAHTHSPMQGPIPNIIALPYGKCPPLHMQAPNWKHLLKLLTRLSESRIEPTVEALAGTKTDLKLRTVIQFMKVHHSSEDWRTIVYLTIDTPIPPQTPNIFKYTNGDVTTFPYSYTTSPLPALLRAGAGDSDLSKCFTVPSTQSTPYPTLPLSLPDFAMYLHSVLENSRRASSDSSGGLRKLAKMVDSFYPADAQEGLGHEFMGPDKRGVGGFFRRALGRGNKDAQNQRGGNAERFEFITPFRIDEYR